MKADLLTLALITGGFTWAFRFLPTRLARGEARPGGALARFLSSTGPAAIVTLVVASMLPMLGWAPAEFGPLGAGVGAVLVVYLVSRSVIGATMAGSAAYGVVFWLLA